jgi:hypothetical protein
MSNTIKHGTKKLSPPPCSLIIIVVIITPIVTRSHGPPNSSLGLCDLRLELLHTRELKGHCRLVLAVFIVDLSNSLGLYIAEDVWHWTLTALLLLKLDDLRTSLEVGGVLRKDTEDRLDDKWANKNRIGIEFFGISMVPQPSKQSSSINSI